MCEEDCDHESHFAWQAQSLVKRVSLFVAGAVFGEIWNDRSAMYFSIQNARGGHLGCEAGY